MENNREPENKHQFETQTGAGGLKFSLLVLTTPHLLVSTIWFLMLKRQSNSQYISVKMHQNEFSSVSLRFPSASQRNL